MGLDRRGFLGVSGGALLCGLSGKTLGDATREDVLSADTAASQIRRPRGLRAQAAQRTTQGKREAVDRLRFGTPSPAPGGQKRVYWIAARSVRWDVAPNVKRDEWMDMPIRGRTRWTAYCYQRFSEGFGRPLEPASMPGPTLEAEVGDVLEVHFRNADERFDQAVTMHPHGVRYTPDYDGTYLGDNTRIGGFVAPGEEFTYTWECTPDSVGVWPYHDHGPNHTLNGFRGLFGQIVIRPKGAPKPDVEVSLWQHQLLPSVTGLDRAFQCFNGRVGAGNTPTVRAKVGQRVALHCFGGDNAYHTFHLHGHRWPRRDGNFADNEGFASHETITAAFTEDNPGRWLYHCHVFSHQDAGMAGWYFVEP